MKGNDYSTRSIYCIIVHCLKRLHNARRTAKKHQIETAHIPLYPCLVGGNPTRSVPALQGRDGLTSYDYGHTWHEYTPPPRAKKHHRMHTINRAAHASLRYFSRCHPPSSPPLVLPNLAPLSSADRAQVYITPTYRAYKNTFPLTVSSSTLPGKNSTNRTLL